MKIDRNNRITSTGTSVSKKPQNDGVFRSLLDSHLKETLAVEQTSEQQSSVSEESIKLITQAADLLDDALRKIEAGDELEPELPQQLARIRQGLQKGEETREIDTLLAVETKRMENL
ncbi:MAG: hypothetical protein R8M38_04100 [Mariprofundaceae bacterium]